MFHKNSIGYKLAALLLGLTFVIPVMAACGGDDKGGGDDRPSLTTSTLGTAATPTATITNNTATPAPTTGSPVKLGAIVSWSGPMAVSGLLADPVIKLVEWQVKQQGGMLGGRELKVVKYDNAGSVANASAGANKLIDSDKVSALVFGGTYTSEIEAVAGVAEERQLLFSTYGAMSDLEQKKFSVCVIVGRYAWVDAWLSLARMLNAKTVGWLGMDDADVRERNGYGKDKMAAAGIETVYDQYAPADTQDYTPYLTKIKYVAPDVLCVDEASEGYLAIGKQIAEIGGLGKTKLLAMTQATTAATKTKGFEGQYVLVSWLPGLTNPGAIKFEQDYKTLIGGVPNLNHVYYYLSLWTAINAIEMAGTDTDHVKVAEAARSGNLEWDAPVGHIRFNTEGFSDQSLTATHVEEGQLIAIQLPAQ